MRKRIGVAALLIMFAAGNVWSAPRLVLPEAEFNFGFSPQNSSITHVFWLKSAGDDTLVIKKIEPGCGCTKAPLERDKIAAGDSTRLEIVFETGSYQGAVAKNPRIETNEATPNKFLRILTRVITRPDSTYPLVIKPYKVDLSQIGDKEREETKFTLTNKADKSLTPILVSTADDCFKVTLPQVIPAGGSAEGTISIKPDMKLKWFEKSFTIQLNDDSKSRYTIPVKRQLRNAAQSSAPQNVNVTRK